MKKINIGLIGFGNVGSGVIKILRQKRALLRNKMGVDMEVVRICDKDITTPRGISVEKELLTTKAQDILDDPQIDVLVELMGGVNPAKDFITEALKKGKNVVTANKALLAENGKQLFAEAAQRGKNIYFEAAVCAGVPIIKAIREGLVANNFESIYGIVNGTSNFILSQMSHEKCSFASALKDAKTRGFAEANPTLDIEGIDSAHKLILLTYLCFGKFVSMSDVFTEGISLVSLDDINYAKELGFEVKLLAISKKEHSELEVRVHPTLLPNTHLLSQVSGVFNAVYASSDLAGNLLFYGPGAGKFSAASAVVSDLCDLTQDLKAGLFRPVLNSVEDRSITRLRKIDDIESRYYIRFMALDKPGVLAKISGVLAKFNISIASVTQKQRMRPQAVPIVMIIHNAREKDMRGALQVIDNLDFIKEKSVAIRIEQ